MTQTIKEFILGEQVWFMVDGILPVQGVITSKHISKDELIILVRNPEYGNLFRHYAVNSEIIFKTKEDIQKHFYPSWQ